MREIARELLSAIRQKLFGGKAVILLGARQTGKTTLMKMLLRHYSDESVWLNADRPEIRAMLTDASVSTLRQLTEGKQLVIIDEAQRIKNIGLTLKLFTDEMPGIQVIASGSSSFELANQINEPLTGRKWEYQLYPVSWSELETAFGMAEALQQLDTRLVFGMYPEVIMRQGMERETLLALSGSYLYKDVFEFRGVRKPEMLWQLLQALALQLGSEVSYNELSGMLGIDRNMRNEITSNRKIYFYDNGIRNAVLENFSPLKLRTDNGALWENFLVSERLKYRRYRAIHGKSYFWRTKTQQEVDYVEETDGQFRAWEFKWNTSARSRFHDSFLDAYKPASAEVITPGNFRTFIC
jgi:predicted AAA+ superfamily ATPase